MWTPPYGYRQIKVTCAKWSSRVSMLRVEFSAEFEQVVNWMQDIRQETLNECTRAGAVGQRGAL
ncbi:hypothetical protein O5623_07330, partial [Escherichia coli]|nr:hypothetical protein [Escherichia coli]